MGLEEKPGFDEKTGLLFVERAVYESLLAHAVAEYPLEACGLAGGENGRACYLYPVANRLKSPVAYEMDPLQQVKAIVAIEAAGQEMTAIYHSHPDGPDVPSATDVERAYYSEAVQIIVSLEDRERPSTRAFTIIGGRVKEVDLIVV